jgi:hypothetical protein
LAAVGILVLLYFVVPLGIGQGGYINLRLLLFAFVIVLAAIRGVSHRKVIIRVGIALLLLRCGVVGYQFVAAQPEAKQLARAVSDIPVNARVLPVEAAADKNQSLFRRPFVHFYAYGVIRRGWAVPSLFHLVGVQPIRLQDGVYCPNDFCGPLNTEEPDWEQVRRHYDFVWIYKSQPYIAGLSRVADLTYSDGTLSIYRLRPVGAFIGLDHSR